MIHKLYLNNFTQNLNNISQTIMVYCFSLEHVNGLLSDWPTTGNDILIQLLETKSVFWEFFDKLCSEYVFQKLFPVPLLIFITGNDIILAQWRHVTCEQVNIQAMFMMVHSVECIERKYWLQRSEFWYPIDLCNNRKWFIRQMRDGFWLWSDRNSQPGSYRPQAFKYLSFKLSRISP